MTEQPAPTPDPYAEAALEQERRLLALHLQRESNEFLRDRNLYLAAENMRLTDENVRLIERVSELEAELAALGNEATEQSEDES